MTVSYSFDVSRNSWFVALKVVCRWRGSIWKSIWKELLVWLIIYYIVMFVYRSEWFLTPDGQRTFEKLCLHVKTHAEWIPLNILLGFFVSMVVDRWRQMFQNLGFIESTAHSVATLFKEVEPTDVLYRRAIVRYLCLAQVLVFRDISMKVRKRFPNLDSIVKAGFMEDEEKKMYEAIDTKFPKYFIPVNWVCSIAMKCRQEGRIAGDNYLSNFAMDIKNYRASLQLLSNFDWVPVPLAYPQLVICTVRIYFLLCTVSRQYIIGEEAVNKSLLDLVVPFMTILQFLFYVGWMKVAESLLNPFGEDDDHFECNYLIDRNIETGLLIVDDTFGKIPPMKEDRFKYQPSPMYTEDSAPKDPGAYAGFNGSVSHLVLAGEAENVPMIPICTEEFAQSRASEKLAAKLGSTMRRRFSRNSSSRSSRAYHSVLPTISVTTASGQPITRSRVDSITKKRELRSSASFADSIDTSDFANPFMDSQVSEQINRYLMSPHHRNSIPILDAVSEESNNSQNAKEQPLGGWTSERSLESEHPAESTPNSTLSQSVPSLTVPAQPQGIPSPNTTLKSILKNRRREFDPSIHGENGFRSEPSSRDPIFQSIPEEGESVVETVRCLLMKKLGMLDEDLESSQRLQDIEPPKDIKLDMDDVSLASKKNSEVEVPIFAHKMQIPAHIL